MAKAGEGLRRVPKGSGCMCVDSKCPPRSGLCIFVGRMVDGSLFFS